MQNSKIKEKGGRSENLCFLCVYYTKNSKIMEKIIKNKN